MRHKKNFNHLSRKSGHRRAMLANMASSLIMHKRIQTTTAKAKALKRYIEPLITRSKNDTTHGRRVVFSYLQDKEAVAELFREVGTKVADRPGGYTRIIKLGTRQGDNADMCLIELVDYNENLLAEKESSRKSSRRRRGGKKKQETPGSAAKTEQTPGEPEESETGTETTAEPEVSEQASAPATEGESSAPAAGEKESGSPEASDDRETVAEAGDKTAQGKGSAEEEGSKEVPEAKQKETDSNEKEEDQEPDSEKKDS